MELRRKLLAEALGTMLLLTVVIGSGIMAERLAGGNAAIALLANALATVGGLYVLIEVLGPVSGAHFNPAVSAVMAIRGDLPGAALLPYVGAQLVGAVLGAWLAHAMFDLRILQFSTTVRSGWGPWIAETVATAGLLLVVLRGPTQPLGWFKKGEIKKPEDLKGIKYRTVGLSAELFKQLGSSVVIMGGADIIPALDRGVIDAAEFNNPTSDKLLGFQDVSKVYMVQSYHQPVEFLELIINKKRWESFDKHTQAIFKYAVMAQSADMTWQFMDRNSADLLELKTKHKVRVVKTPKSVLDAQLKAWDKIVKEKSEGNPFFAKVLDSQRKWAERVVPLRQEIMVDNEPAYNHYFKNKKS